MPKSAVEMEDAAADVTRQAELVVMDCLKSWNCPRALNAFTEKSSASRVSPIASERFSTDMEVKKKAADGWISVLEYLVSNTSGNKDKSSSSSRRRPDPTAKEGEIEAGIEWTKEEISALKKAIKKTSSVEDKNARWKQIVSLVGNDKSKKHCYVKYKELKEEQKTNAAKKASPRRKRSSNKGDSDEADPSDPKTPAKLAKDDQNDVLENGKSYEDDSSSRVELSVSGASEEPATAFVVSRRSAAPEANSSHTLSEALEMEDCEDMGMLLEQPTTSRAQPRRTNSNVGSSFASGSTRIPTASDVAAVQQLLFGANKKAFSSHWEEQVSFVLW